MLKCIVINDEPLSVQLIRNYIKKIKFIELSGSFSNSKEAMAFLEKNAADLILFDIKKTMPQNSLLGTMKKHAMIVLTSSNPKLALEAFDHDVIDFLLNPIEYTRFQKSIDKAYRIKEAYNLSKQEDEQAAIKGGYIFIKEATRLLRVELDDIFYVMGLKNYVSILTRTQRIVSLQTMKQMEALLPSNRFIRVHRSYFVAMDKIISVEKQQIFVKDKVIPIGNLYTEMFMKKLSRISNQ